ncbi:MAG: hypothetical protein NTX03_06500 [Bacteroidetes bacterium]|nr:hypothetical protein [Bacteroidota bacterium]
MKKNLTSLLWLMPLLALMAVSCSTHKTAYKLERGALGFAGGKSTSTLKSNTQDLTIITVAKSGEMAMVESPVKVKEATSFALPVKTNSVLQSNPKPVIGGNLKKLSAKINSTVSSAYKGSRIEKVFKETGIDKVAGWSDWPPYIKYAVLCRLTFIFYIIPPIGLILGPLGMLASFIFIILFLVKELKN